MTLACSECSPSFFLSILMSASRISRLTALRGRSYATSASGLNANSLAKAEQLSADWKGTNFVGGTTKNYIGGEFVESKADKWLEIHDPVSHNEIRLF